MQVAVSCKKHGAKEVEIYSVDLTSTKDIDKLCRDMLSKHKIDVLVSGGGGSPCRLTSLLTQH